MVIFLAILDLSRKFGFSKSLLFPIKKGSSKKLKPLNVTLNYSLNSRLASAKSPTVAEPLLSIAGKTMYSSSLGT